MIMLARFLSCLLHTAHSGGAGRWPGHAAMSDPPERVSETARVNHGTYRSSPSPQAANLLAVHLLYMPRGGAFWCGAAGVSPTRGTATCLVPRPQRIRFLPTCSSFSWSMTAVYEANHLPSVQNVWLGKYSLQVAKHASLTSVGPQAQTIAHTAATSCLPRNAEARVDKVWPMVIGFADTRATILGCQ
jgi:hypothetical protein